MERLDKTAFRVTELGDDSYDREYWSKTPQERLAALEMLRQETYGYDPATAKVERVIRVVDLGDI